MAPTVVEHAFSDSGWALGLSAGFGLLALGLLALTVLPHRRPAWTRALAALGLAACSAVTVLALRDRATKVGRLRLETAPVRLTLERAWPGRSLELGPGELRAIGLVSLGEDPAAGEPGFRQLLFGVPGEREVRSFLEPDVQAAERLAERIAESFDLPLQRFTGPPQRR